jgi:hypothetical protein
MNDAGIVREHSCVNVGPDRVVSAKRGSRPQLGLGVGNISVGRSSSDDSTTTTTTRAAATHQPTSGQATTLNTRMCQWAKKTREHQKRCMLHHSAVFEGHGDKPCCSMGGLSFGQPSHSGFQQVDPAEFSVRPGASLKMSQQRLDAATKRVTMVTAGGILHVHINRRVLQEVWESPLERRHGHHTV